MMFPSLSLPPRAKCPFQIPLSVCDATCESLWFEALFKCPPPPFLPPLFHASDGHFSLSDQQKYGKFQREEGSRRARRKEGQAASRPTMRSESAAHSVTYTRVAYLVSRPSSEGAAFKASVFKSVVKRFHVGLRNFEAERERRRRGGRST